MLVDAKSAYDFVNSHAPIEAQLLFDNAKPVKLFIISEEVDCAGSVRRVTDVVECNDGLVDIESVRDILGY